MKRSLPILVLASLCVVSTALATTYVRVEKDGTKTYSDRPMPGGVPIDLKPAQSYSAPPTPASSEVRSAAYDDSDFRYDSCRIKPDNDSTFTNPEMVPISVETNPPIRASDIVTLRVDGQTVGEPGTLGYTMAAPVDRGTHTVSVTIMNRRGMTVCTSTSSFHVMRPSLNSPANAGRPTRPNIPRPTPH